MSYSLTITKLVPNADYEEQCAAYNRSNRSGSFDYSAQQQFPARQLEVRVLTVEVTEEMFSAIRKACLEAM